MLIAGEPSGDLLAAELVQALRQELTTLEATPTTDFQPLHASLEPRFFGAGGPRMAAAGVELAVDMTQHAVVGLSDVLRNLLKFRRLFQQLYQIAVEREPDAIVCIDFSGFNRRFAHAIRGHVRGRVDWFHDWDPKMVQYVSPQVWASREGRIHSMARDLDLLLSIFPFEKDWYARRVPRLPVEFIGHPILDRYGAAGAANPGHQESQPPVVLLLPGSRPAELSRHLPVMRDAAALIQREVVNVRVRMVLPNDELIAQAKALGLPEQVEVSRGELAQALRETTVAIASTGTVTLECAYFGVPTVALYITSRSTYQIAKRMIKVKYLAMPNLLVDGEVYPEFIQNAATPENIGRATVELLKDEKRRAAVRARLTEAVRSLGEPGASKRAAHAIIGLLGPEFRQEQRPQPTPEWLSERPSSFNFLSTPPKEAVPA